MKYIIEFILYLLGTVAGIFVGSKKTFIFVIFMLICIIFFSVKLFFNVSEDKRKGDQINMLSSNIERLLVES